MPLLVRLGFSRVAFVLTPDLANFSRDLSYFLLFAWTLSYQPNVWRALVQQRDMGFEPAQSQLRCKIIHDHFICLIFPGKPAPDSDDPVFFQLSHRELGEATSASEVVQLLLHALVLQKCIDDPPARSARVSPLVISGSLPLPTMDRFNQLNRGYARPAAIVDAIGGW